MPIAVVIVLNDDGQVMLGEVDAATIDTTDFVPAETLDEAFDGAETLLVGNEAPPEIEEEAFTQAAMAGDDMGGED